MGDPHKGLKYVHIAGTNGKGSTAAMLSSILQLSGYKVGLYTSPHIHHFNERIQINSVPISNEKLSEVRSFVNVHIGREDHLSDFAVTTAIAFEYFSREKCDIVVLEVGLGGRLDPTNVINSSEVSVITSIGMDHQKELGGTIEQIAREKAGIIKSNGTVVLNPQVKKVEDQFKTTCLQKNAKLSIVDMSTMELLDHDIEGQRFNFLGYKNMYLSLLGEHQLQNVAGVLYTVKALRKKDWNISDEDVRHGLAQVKWNGRFEIISKDHPIIIADGAHNTQSTEMLMKNLKHYFPEKQMTFVVAMMEDKDYVAMLEISKPYAKRFIAVDMGYERAVPSSDLVEHIKNNLGIEAVACHTVEAGMQLAVQLTENEIICVFGSLYIMGRVKSE